MGTVLALARGMTHSHFLTVGLLCLTSACSMAIRPMPAATAHDPELEAQAKRAVYGTRDFAGMNVVSESDKILDARIVSDFDVEQNELTGAPTKRSVNIALAVKDEDGKCRWVTVMFTQEHMGGGRYGGLHGELPVELAAMECPADAAAPAAAESPGGAQPVAVAMAANSPAPENTAEQQAQIDALVDGLGPNAASECKAYVREVCKTQKGPAGVETCKAYADSMRVLANSPNGATACQSAMGGLSGH